VSDRKDDEHKPEEKAPPDHRLERVDESSDQEPAMILKIVERHEGASRTRREFLRKLSATTAALAGGAAVSAVSSGCASMGRKSRSESKYGTNDVSETEQRMGHATMTLPCDAPLPAGAVCICDRVATTRTFPGTEMVCICDTVCTCDTVSTQVCTCDTVCTCNTVCTCHSQSSGGGGYTVSYWYPN